MPRPVTKETIDQIVGVLKSNSLDGTATTKHHLMQVTGSHSNTIQMVVDEFIAKGKVSVVKTTAGIAYLWKG